MRSGAAAGSCRGRHSPHAATDGLSKHAARAVKRIPVRALYRAALVAGREAPYDNLTLKIYYPCNYGNTFEERDTGFVPPDAARAPFPVVIVMPGVNISQEAYGWIAQELAKAGFAVVTYSWVTVEIGERVSVSPGVALDALHRDRYGQAISCPALPAILGELERVQQDSLLAGHLDLGRIVLGGHSAGGTMALVNAKADWVPGIRGAFAYGAHTAGNLRLGWPEDSIMPLSRNLPLLIMGGTRDGVIAASGYRYRDGSGDDPDDRIERTFREGIEGKEGDRHLLMVDGANHFSFVWPRDTTTGRPYLDRKARGGGKRLRAYIAELVVSFCRRVCMGDAALAAAFETLCSTDHPLAAVAETK